MQYVLSRATNHKTRHVLCLADRFYTDVPGEIRRRGPWQILRRGDINKLKPELRLGLALDGYCYVETHPVGFKVEVSR